MTHLTLPIPPSVNRIWRHFNGRIVISADGKAFKDIVFWEAKKRRVEKLHGQVELIAILHPRLRKKETDKPGRRIDLDNLLKILCDSLNGIAYDDDCQIVSLRAMVGEPVQDGAVSVEVRNAQQGLQKAPQGAIAPQPVAESAQP